MELKTEQTGPDGCRPLKFTSSGPKLPRLSAVPASVNAPLCFCRDPIVVCKRSLVRDLSWFPRVLGREVRREVRLITDEASFVISQGAKKVWKGVKAVGGLPRRAGERRRVKRVKGGCALTRSACSRPVLWLADSSLYFYERKVCSAVPGKQSDWGTRLGLQHTLLSSLNV